MPCLRVWAPLAQRVSVALKGERLALHQSPGGQWSLEVPSLSAGDAYAFFLDDEGPFPDPRSPWQPQGILGASVWVDHGAFAWDESPGRQPPPLERAVFYELHIGTFTPEGSFDAAIGHLDHLRELGVTHVELMPVAEFSGAHGWGYDGADLFAPHHSYGPPEGLKRLVQAAHARGLAVIMDVVYNHFGPAGNFLDRFGPYSTEAHRNPWGRCVNLDGPGSDGVRAFFIDNALMWLRDYHCDGLRLDAVHALFDSSATHFLEDLRCQVAVLQAHLGRPLIVTAESDLNDPRLIRPPSQGGYGLDALWADDFHHALHTLLTGETQGYYADFGGLAPLAKALRLGFVYDGIYSASRQRHFGRPLGSCQGSQLIVCIQNHDQVGNRRQGERLGQLVDLPRQKLAAALLLCGPFVPLLFQGQEWGASTPFLYFTDHQDPALALAVTEGRRKEFAAFMADGDKVPDPQAPDSFLSSKLKWEELRQAPHAELLDWHRRLIALRRRLPAVTDLDELELSFNAAQQWLILGRGRLRLACNFSGEARLLPWQEDWPQGLLFGSQAGASLGADGLHLPAYAVAAYGCESAVP